MNWTYSAWPAIIIACPFAVCLFLWYLQRATLTHEIALVQKARQMVSAARHTMKVGYGPPIDERDWPDSENSYHIVPFHVVLKVLLPSGFTSRVSLPSEFTGEDCDVIIDALNRSKKVGATSVLKPNESVPPQTRKALS